MDCEQVQQQIEAYALGALDPADESAIRQHLASCPRCRRVLRSYEPVVAALPEALAAASPMRAHPSVKDRVMAGLEAAPPRRTFRWAPWPLVAALTLIALAATVGWGYRANEELAHERAVNVELQGKLRAKDQLTVFEVVDSPTTTKLSLRSTTGSSAYGKIFTKADAADVVVMVNRLPQPPAGETYELWLTSAGTTRPAGRLDVDSDGFAYIVYHADHNGPTFQSAVVTLQTPGATVPGPMRLLSWQAAPQASPGQS